MCVLGGVVQQVGEHLRQPDYVAIDVDRFGRQVNDEILALSVDQHVAGIHGVSHGIRQQHPRLLQPDFALADAAHVHQIINQPGHVLHLALHHGARLLQRPGIALGQLHDLQAVLDRGQRVPQFMGEGRQKHVLAPVDFGQFVGLLPNVGEGFLQRPLRFPPFRDVSDVALDDGFPVFAVHVADELHVDPPPRLGFKR